MIIWILQFIFYKILEQKCFGNNVKSKNMIIWILQFIFYKILEQKCFGNKVNTEKIR
jgi:hypothetical protein